MDITFFNIPQIVFNDRKIVFPLKKCEALIYYLVLKGQATRDEVASLLWGDEEEDIARKNLRNAIYKIKKAFDHEIIESPQKSIIRINTDIAVKSDIESFLNEDLESVNLYDGEFLKGFYIKDCNEFEEWVWGRREYFKALFTTKLTKYINSLIKSHDYGKAESCCIRLIDEDELDERSYRLLIDVYIKTTAYNKGIEVYKRLEEVLDRELGITPDLKTRELFDALQSLRSEGTEDNEERDLKDFFYGRNNELKLIKSNYNSFIQNLDGKSLLIEGEAGIGKSKLVEKFLDSIRGDSLYILNTNCYQAEEDFFLKPWYNVFSQLIEIVKSENIKIPPLWIESISGIFPVFADFNNSDRVNIKATKDKMKFKIAEEAIIGIFNKLSIEKKVIFIFEDIHWMDPMSLSLLMSIILRQEKGNIIFVATSREGYERKLERYLEPLNRKSIIRKIKLERFSREEVMDFAAKMLPTHSFSQELKENLYRETEGNTFFLVEYLKSLYVKGDEGLVNSKIQDILNSRFSDISEEGKKILNIASIFFDEVPIDIITHISGKEELDIIDILEELCDKAILRESENKSQSFEFTHQKLREFIYNKQLPLKRRVLHNRIAEIIEKFINNDRRDMFEYPRLIYHFKNGSNYLKALEYSIKNINLYLDFSHELFPILMDSDHKKDAYLYLSKEQTLNSFEDISKLISKIKDLDNGDKDIGKLEIAYFHLVGRYLIKEGEYEEGTNYIKQMIELALKNQDYLFALKGLKQMIYLSIQTHNVSDMSMYIESALKYAREISNETEYWTIMRLKGLNKLMLCEYEESESILLESIEALRIMDYDGNKYALNIAGAYNYIGDIKRYQKKYLEAVDYYNRAIKVCNLNNAITSLAVFKTNIGQAYYENGDFHLAREYFESALKNYEQVDYIWGYSIAASYITLMLIKDGKYEDALGYLNKAIRNALKIKNPFEKGIVYGVMGEISNMMDENPRLRYIFKDTIVENKSYYFKKADENLIQIKNINSIQMLNNLRSAL